MGTRPKKNAPAKRASSLGKAPTRPQRVQERARLAEEAEAEAASRLRVRAHLYERAPVGLVTLDPLGNVLEANATLARMLGCSSEADLAHRRFELWIQGSDRPRFVHHFYETQRSDPERSCSCHVTLVRPGPGPLFTAYLESARAVDLLGRRVVHTVVSDAAARFADESKHERRLAEEREFLQRLEDERRRFEKATTASAELAQWLDLPDLLRCAASVGTQHVAWYVAIDMADEAGYVRRAAFARRDREAADLPLDPYAPRGSALVVRTGRAEMLSSPTLADLLGLASVPAELDALSRQVGDYLCLPLDAHGRTLGAMAFVAQRGARFSQGDVARAKQLAHHAALAIDNARLYRDAQEADRRKDEFLAMLGHELRNPLAAVVTTARNARRREGGDPEAARQMAEVVERQGERLVRLVDDLLDVSRITRGKVNLQRCRISLDDVVMRAVESTRPLLEARGHALSVSRAEDAVVLDADPARLEQVVVNLLANAAKYTPPGGRVDVEIGAAGGEAVLRVRDTGAGIPRDQLQNVFAPFTQLGTTLDRKDRGLGIGLALARSLVELHGGRITAHSDGPGRGSELVVRLPRPSDAEQNPPNPPTPQPPNPPTPELRVQRRRVLVVEDDPDIAAALRDELELLGQDVRTAEDGPVALDVAREQRPELVLIDIGLPGMDGFQVATRMRNEPAVNDATLVAVTGYGGADVTQQCKAAGFDRHYTKPLSEDALLDLLREP